MVALFHLVHTHSWQMNSCLFGIRFLRKVALTGLKRTSNVSDVYSRHVIVLYITTGDTLTV